MKTKIKNNGYGLLAVLIVVIGFSMAVLSLTGCSDDEGDSDYTKSVPKAPEGVMATALDDTKSMLISWPGVPGALQYYVYKGGQRIAVITEDSYGNNAYNTTASNLIPEVDYSFTVSAVNSFGESQRSSPVSKKLGINVEDLSSSWPEGYYAGTENWYKFTTSTTTQFLHCQTDSSSGSVSVELYNDDGSLWGGITISNNSSCKFDYLTSNRKYIVKVSNYSGNYFRLTINSSIVPPGKTPTSMIAYNTWYDGYIEDGSSNNNVKWFKFNAAYYSTLYIHYYSPSVTYVYIQIYDSNGQEQSGYYSTISSSNSKNIYPSYNGDYYIKVTPYDSNGTFYLAISSSSTAPSY